jgi:hypothetical protein
MANIWAEHLLRTSQDCYSHTKGHVTWSSVVVQWVEFTVNPFTGGFSTSNSCPTAREKHRDITAQQYTEWEDFPGYIQLEQRMNGSSTDNTVGARGRVVGSGTMLQAGRSWVQFPMRSLVSSIDLILPATLWPLTEMSTRNLPGDIGWLP